MKSKKPVKKKDENIIPKSMKGEQKIPKPLKGAKAMKNMMNKDKYI